MSKQANTAPKNPTPPSDPAAKAAAAAADAAGSTDAGTGQDLLASAGAAPSGAQIIAAENGDKGSREVVDAAVGGTQAEFQEAASKNPTPPGGGDEEAASTSSRKKYVAAVNIGRITAGKPIKAADLATFRDKTGKAEFDKQFARGNIREA